jgi:hypothetical protein
VLQGTVVVSHNNGYGFAAYRRHPCHRKWRGWSRGRCSCQSSCEDRCTCVKRHDTTTTTKYRNNNCDRNDIQQRTINKYFKTTHKKGRQNTFLHGLCRCAETEVEHARLGPASPCYYTVVTRLLHYCYMVVALLLHFC